MTTNLAIIKVDDIYSGDDVLCHYGVKGMHWGIRRYQNADGTLTIEGKEHYAPDTLPKGTELRRISYSYTDPVYKDEKHFSLNDEDDAAWSKVFGPSYRFDLAYRTTKDLKIMNETKMGELYLKSLKKNKIKKLANAKVSDIEKFLSDKTNGNIKELPSYEPAYLLSKIIGGNLDSTDGKLSTYYKKAIKKAGYNGIMDVNGRLTQNMKGETRETGAKDPIIIFNPLKNTRRDINNDRFSDSYINWLKNSYPTFKNMTDEQLEAASSAELDRIRRNLIRR